MKIRSNMQCPWHIKGLVFDPGTINDVVTTDAQILEAITEFANAGKLTILESDSILSVTPVQKIEKIEVKEVSKVAPVLNDPTTFLHIKEDDTLNVKTMDVVVEKTDVITAAAMPVTVSADVDAVETVEVAQAPVAIVEEGANDVTSGFIVVPGKVPGEGKIKSIDSVIKQNVETVQEVLKEAAKELETLDVKAVTPVEIPEDVQKIYDMNPNKRKSVIMKLTDVDFLKKLAQFTVNEKLVVIISERISELQK